MQKLYNKIHLNGALALTLFFNAYFVIVTSMHEILFSCISMSSLSSV